MSRKVKFRLRGNGAASHERRRSNPRLLTGGLWKTDARRKIDASVFQRVFLIRRNPRMRCHDTPVSDGSEFVIDNNGHLFEKYPDVSAFTPRFRGIFFIDTDACECQFKNEPCDRKILSQCDSLKMSHVIIKL